MTTLDPLTSRPYPPTTIQRVLHISPKVLMYRIPPLTSTAGFKASSWTTNPSDQFFTCRLRIIEVATPTPNPQDPASEKLTTNVVLEDPATGDLFAACPYTTPAAVQQALDSSRFFAIRVQGEGGMRATLGMGFEERSDAFDFSIALQDVRRVLGMEGTPATKAPGRASGRSVVAMPTVGKEEEKRDFSLKKGQTIRVNIGGAGGKGRRSNMGGGGNDGEGEGEGKGLFSIAPPPAAAGAGGAVPFLPPPPSTAAVKAERRRSRSPQPPGQQQQTAEEMGFDDGEFGEFQ
ncbi:hypothetical protein LTS18_003621 [Coniosporium uncinatum]|uniref:Uncharacterized protein n=1 Tax=Coniosporium uncinatum TaxID=93489 RepID=A0ACC3D6M3_9PEZI|nr:hypothetical protein LTS18_003621 [Coniosporium uncinatum]